VSLNSYATYQAIATAAEDNAAALRRSVAEVEAMGAVDGENIPDLTLQIITNQLLMWEGFARRIRQIARDS
jgi:hypothetical protein